MRVILTQALHAVVCAYYAEGLSYSPKTGYIEDKLAVGNLCIFCIFND